ncbi:MAG: efflux RND transporter permease subunit, partial [Candidatus Zixiibacteriota bacterium]
YSIASTIRSFVDGEVVTRYREGDNEYDVRVRLKESARSTTDDVGRLLVSSDKDIPGKRNFLVPLSHVGKIEKTSAIGKYNRYDRLREVKVNSNVASDAYMGTVVGQIMNQAQKIDLPPGYHIGVSGEGEIMAESFGHIFTALILAVIFIYLLLASQFESFFDPFSIMFSLPMSLVGAIAALLLFRNSISIVSLIGIILLMGLVTKNAILLVDFIKQNRRRGAPRTEAILIAGPIRLRPILMTTFAMIFGMLPLALGIGPGAEFRAPMARAVIGGLISSTLLTLVVVPIVYTYIDDIVAFLLGRETIRPQEDEIGDA